LSFRRASKLAYRQAGPVLAGFVTKPEDWKYSSAGDFCGMKGLVELTPNLEGFYVLYPFYF
jgi:hypothetical protein